METYLRAFDNWKQNNLARLLPMTEFTHNNAKNASIGYTLFILNYGYYLKVLFKKNNNLYLKSRFADKLVKKLRELIKVYYQNPFYT